MRSLPLSRHDIVACLIPIALLVVAQSPVTSAALAQQQANGFSAETNNWRPPPDEEARPGPPIAGGRYAGAFFAGAGGAAVAWAGGGLLGAAAGGGWDGIIPALVGGVVLTPFLSAAGVNLVGGGGRYGATLAGAAVGVLAGGGIAVLAANVSNDPFPLMLLGMIVVPSVGGIIGYNISANDPGEARSSGALLDTSDGPGLRAQLPQLAPLFDRNGRAVGGHVQLLSGRF